MQDLNNLMEQYYNDDDFIVRNIEENRRYKKGAITSRTCVEILNRMIYLFNLLTSLFRQK